MPEEISPDWMVRATKPALTLDEARRIIEQYGLLRAEGEVRSWGADMLHDAALCLLKEIEG